MDSSAEKERYIVERRVIEEAVRVHFYTLSFLHLAFIYSFQSIQYFDTLVLDVFYIPQIKLHFSD